MDVHASPVITPADLPAQTGILRFSVIIPLEFHRGQGMQCLLGWTREQTYPRNAFEIVLAVPPGLPESEVSQMVALLAAHDQVLRFPDRHDIALCEAAAKHARGEYLFFTESHCLPDPDTLAQVEQAIAAHPEWAGFSCQSVPITHNLLSKIEADFYDRGIQAAMHHPWRNILDQCFVTTRKAYLAIGGFDGTLGHFAEWVLSARYHQHGLKLGYWPAARINHFYIGELDEWREFTEDFAAGEIHMLKRSDQDPILDLFDENPEWAARHENTRSRAWKMVAMLAGAIFSRKKASSASHSGLPQRPPGGNWRDLGAWAARGLMGTWAPLIAANWRVWRSHALLSLALWRKNQSRAEMTLPSLCDALSGRRRLQLLRRHRPSIAQQEGPVSGQGEWIPGNDSPLVYAGFHPAETWHDTPLRWSTPAAMVDLPLQKGKHELSLEWMRRASSLSIQFFINERLIDPASVKLGKQGARIRFRVSREGTVRFGWVCDPHRAPADPRRLGVALRRLTWAVRS